VRFQYLFSPLKKLITLDIDVSWRFSTVSLIFMLEDEKQKNAIIGKF